MMASSIPYADWTHGYHVTRHMPVFPSISNDVRQFTTPIHVHALSIMTAPTDKANNCEIILRGMTTLRNRRQLPEKPLTYVYDGLFSCAEQLDKDGVGTFRHFVGKDANVKRDGTYEMYAMVITITPFFLLFPLNEHADSTSSTKSKCCER